MFKSRLFSPLALATGAFLFLASCDSVEERAEEHYQSGLALLESGDVDRAVLEFRNAFRLDPTHIESYRSLGRVMLDEKNDKRRAYRQFLRVAEQLPDDLEARIELSEIAFTLTNWDEFARHGGEAEKLAPENPRVQAIALARLYQIAAQNENLADMNDLAEQASNLVESQPENGLLRALRSDAALRNSAFEKALPDVDWMLARDPQNPLLLQRRLAILAQLGDNDAVEAQLREMIANAPDDDSFKAALLAFFMSTGLTDKAEDYLRERAAASDESEPKLDLINFLRRVRSEDAAIAELEKLIAENEDNLIFQLLFASIVFDRNEQDAAITQLEAALRAASETAEGYHNAKVALARMFLATGNEVGARAQVAEVLASNVTHPEALKLNAAWKIDADEVETAIADLRTVLDQEPEDAQAMTLMAQAYSRSGQASLAQDFMALAVEASGNAPTETIRYTRILVEQENYASAEDLLLTALRQAPDNVALVLNLGEIYVATEDFGRLEQVISSLRSLDTPQATEAANRFEAARINQQSGTAQALQYLESLSATADNALSARLNLVQARLRTGQVESALEEIRVLETENPDNLGITFLRSAAETAAGNLDTAETLLRTIVTTNPLVSSNVWLQLARLGTRDGDASVGEGVVDEALTHLPEDNNLLWAKASYLERGGDIDGAIQIYEGLYARNSSSVIVANNLASMLSTYKTDEDSLQRAWVVARRFRDTEIPQMQDTYGWILHRRGEVAEALSYLEGAAAALTTDPIVQYHLGQNYLANNRTADAIAQFTKVVEIANPADQRSQIVDARAQLEALEVPAEPEGQ